MSRPSMNLLVGMLVVSASVLSAADSLHARDGGFPFAQREKPPAWPANLIWLNSAGPLELRELRGKFVLLDFWTYCCINCMHILPELHRLEQAWPKNLVVIGVHSAKFSTEQQTPNIEAAIQRYKIEHPVVNDARHELWDAYGVQGWPTLVLIDPEGNAVWGTSGEVTFEQIDKLLRAAMPYYRAHRLLDETPLRFNMAARTAADTPLRFPGKVIADETGGRLFIADSNHNRIVVARLDGTLLDVTGSGAPGQKDGEFAAAEFNQPQGMALCGNELFVADTENHEIRRVDLAARKVATVAGTGRQARGTNSSHRGGGKGDSPHLPERPGGSFAQMGTVPFSASLHTALSSPWDVLVHGDELFIAMAGCHQIWKMKLDGSAIGPYAGNGVEDIVDGPLLAAHPFQPGYASFAQPSGLASDGKWLYVADSEGSSIRAAPFSTRQKVFTVVGTARLPAARLFTFGDVDGPAATARFQHPLGVLYHDGKIYVADTYNSKIRVVDPRDGNVKSLSGTKLFEPGGLAVAGGKLCVADTNNHRICTIDLKTGQLAALTIAGLKPPEPPTPVVKRALGGERLPVTAVRVDHGQVRLRVELELPEGYKLNPLAPLEYVVEEFGTADSLVARDILGKPVRIKKPAAEFEIVLPVTAAAGRDTIHMSVDYYYCREGAEGICKVGSAAWIVPLELSDKAGSSIVRLQEMAK